MAKFKRSRTGRVVWWIWPLTAVVLLIMLSMVVVVFGNVSGIEISKQDLTIREFNFRHIPGLRWQIGAVYHDFPNSAATDVAIATHLKPLRPGEKAEWDLVQFEEFGSDAVQGDAAILYEILGQTDETLNFYWVLWSKEHPTRAAELWPSVQDLAKMDLYWAIPPLMELYNSGNNDSSLIPERNESIIQSAKLAVEEARAQGNDEVIQKICQRLAPYDDRNELKALMEKESEKNDQ